MNMMKEASKHHPQVIKYPHEHPSIVVPALNNTDGTRERKRGKCHSHILPHQAGRRSTRYLTRCICSPTHVHELQRSRYLMG